MNWKLLLIALTLIAGVSARAAPAEPATESPATTQAAIAETTTILTEKPTTVEPSTTAAPSTVRYFLASLPTKTTNAQRKKYANNYANLITKYTLNNNRIMGNVSSNNSNMFVTLHGVVVASSLPDAAIVSSSSAATSNSSSKPLVFVDADNVNPTITTKRAFMPLKGGGSWSNYNVEVPKIVSTRPKRPIIHKIISKWSDNPNVVFNLVRDDSLSTTQATEISDLTNHLVLNAFRPSIATTSFDQLPAILGQHFINQHATTNGPPPVTKIVNILAKRPENEATKTNCRRVKIKFAGVKSNEFSSVEECGDVNIQIDNKIENVNSLVTTNDYETPNNDKFEDSTSGLDDLSGEKQEEYIEVLTDSPQIVNSITQISKPGNNKQTEGTLKGGDKKKKKKKHGAASAAQTDDDDEDGGGGGDVGSMVMTMMTMMAVFNPFNFGVWGIIMAPMAAMLFGGICFTMYQFMHHSKQPQWPAHPPWASDPWPKPQEIIIRNKIKHSPIPIKVMHLHKSAPPPPQIYHMPMDSYGPPIISHTPPPKRPSHSYGEPPVDSYHPTAIMGAGPYNRKSHAHLRRPTKNSYKFKLL